MREPAEAHDDPQVQANGYLARVDTGWDATLPMVTSPVQFDEAPAAPARAPEAGEHTEALLLELGLGWEEITALKERGVVT